MQPTVLSVQSHVVHGYVGNKSAVFPLQLQGFEVDTINSVQFSNHTGYPSFRGQVLDGDQLWTLVEGLQANQLFHYTHLLTGYIGSVSFLRRIIQLVKELREVNPDLVYVCDPVMGDNGKLYVPPELVDVFRTEMVSHATVMTPNQFEIQLLTGIEVKSEMDAARACHALHEQGVSVIVITSLTYEGLGDDQLEIFASRCWQKTKKEVQYRLLLPCHPQDYTGCGDLMAALLLAHFEKHPDDLATVIELAAATMQAVILRTYESNEQNLSGKPELKLVASKCDIENPTVVYTAERVNHPIIHGVLFTKSACLATESELSHLVHQLSKLQIKVAAVDACIGGIDLTASGKPESLSDELGICVGNILVVAETALELTPYHEAGCYTCILSPAGDTRDISLTDHHTRSVSDLLPFIQMTHSHPPQGSPFFGPQPTPESSPKGVGNSDLVL